MNNRKSLLELSTAIEFKNEEAWNEILKYIDNCWKLDSKGGNVYMFSCRFKTSNHSTPKNPRNSTFLKHLNCPAKMKVVVNGTVTATKYGIWEHSHSLDLIDKARSCSFVREYIRNESSRGYTTQAIHAAFHKQFGNSFAGARFVTLDRVRRYCNLANMRSFDATLESLLHSNHFQTYFGTFPEGRLLVFANKEQLNHLVKYGNRLVLMDACGSLGGFYLVTMLVRDNFRCWLPAGQFWIEKEHSEFYIHSFQLLREWTNGMWNPKSFLIDGSNIEAKAIEHNFAGVNILRCTRHTTQSLKTRLSHAEDVMYHMQTAVFAETLADCQYHLNESLKHCPYEDLKRYIKSQWTLESSGQWSLYARKGFPLVGEITTINPCESYHSLVRLCTDSSMSLLDCTGQILTLIKKRFNNAADAKALDHHSISSVAVHNYHELEIWPLPYQLLVGAEITKAQAMFANGTWKFQWFKASTDFTCRCKFYKSHRLPCKHLFIKDMNQDKKWFEASNWNNWNKIVFV
jgi:hypothetical protein